MENSPQIPKSPTIPGSPKGDISIHTLLHQRHKRFNKTRIDWLRPYFSGWNYSNLTKIMSISVCLLRICWVNMGEPHVDIYSYLLFWHLIGMVYVLCPIHHQDPPTYLVTDASQFMAIFRPFGTPSIDNSQHQIQWVTESLWDSLVIVGALLKCFSLEVSRFAPEKLPFLKGNYSSNHPFFRGKLLNFGGVTVL